MKKPLITTVFILSTIVFAQSAKAKAKANPQKIYSFTYQIIANSKSSVYNRPGFRAYVLKSLEQDKGYPEKVARSFCAYRAAGQSRDDISLLTVKELKERQRVEHWSEDRFKAYMHISATGMVGGLRNYCPQFKSP